jgi:hypothetical protein
MRRARPRRWYPAPAEPPVHEPGPSVQFRTVSALALHTPSVKAAAGAPHSPAGPVDDGSPTRLPPGLDGAPLLQGLRFGMRPMSFNLGAATRVTVAALYAA